MKKFFLVILLVVFFNLGYSQGFFSEDFLIIYKAKLAENGQLIELSKLQKMLEKQKLDDVLVYEIYASFFNYKDVDQANRTLLLAYALEYEVLNNFKFYIQESNLLMEKSTEAFSKNWTKYTEGKNLKDDALSLFVVEELKRLKDEGIDVTSLNSKIN